MKHCLSGQRRLAGDAREDVTKEVDMRTRKAVRIIALLAGLATVVVALTAGCGSAPLATGSIVMNVEWPERGGKFIPEAANSLVARIFQNEVELERFRTMVARPANVAVIEGIPVGPTVVHGSAYASQDGSGDALAVGQAEVHVLAGETTPVYVTLEGIVQVGNLHVIFQ